ncbi:MAG: SOS response-associated peptidase [Ectothiorhodospiraceae bacterium]|nr:SOS response-associated peptidase [Ectothiorhodospiraceae bacterium]
MCGRYALRVSAPEVARILGLETVGSIEPRFNIAPTQPVLACRVDARGTRAVSVLRWGLIPHWARDDKSAYRMINARAETAAARPAFRVALRRRRCLVPADGYYEWQAGPSGKQPWFFHLDDDRPFCFAGIWERWDRGPDGPVESCAILTTAPSALAAEIHDRMPVIVRPEDYATWLDPGIHDPAALAPLLRPYDEPELVVHPVSRWVNSPAHDDPRCTEPAPSV